jgi:hypothetical protein
MFITVLMSGQWENCMYYSWNYTQIIILLLKCAYFSISGTNNNLMVSDFLQM